MLQALHRHLDALPHGGRRICRISPSSSAKHVRSFSSAVGWAAAQHAGQAFGRGAEGVMHYDGKHIGGVARQMPRLTLATLAN